MALMIATLTTLPEMSNVMKFPFDLSAEEFDWILRPTLVVPARMRPTIPPCPKCGVSKLTIATDPDGDTHDHCKSCGYLAVWSIKEWLPPVVEISGPSERQMRRSAE